MIVFSPVIYKFPKLFLFANWMEVIESGVTDFKVLYCLHWKV